MTAVAGVRHEPQTFYFGGTGGGVWKTTDGGSNWQVLSDKDFKTGSIGAIAVSESDPNVVYVGTGEEPIRGNVSHGDGVYKSTDGGRPGRTSGLRDTRQIARVRVHPDEPRHRLRRGAGPRLGPQRGARHLPLRGRRQDLEEDPLRRRQDRRLGPRDGSVQPARSSTPAFWQVVRQPWELVVGRARARASGSPPTAATRWKKLTERASRGPLGQGRRRRLGGEARAASSRSSRPGTAGLFRQRRRRREVDARQRRAQDPRARLVLLLDLSRPEEPGHRLPAERAAAQVDRRRQDLRLDARARTATTTTCGSIRTTRTALHRRQRRRRDDHATTAARAGRRSTTSRRRSSTASRPTTSSRTGSTARSRTTRTSRIPSGVPGDGIDRRTTGTRRAAARAAGWRSDPEGSRTSSTPASTAARSRATTTAPGRPATSWPGPSSPTGTRRRT